jgi:LEA14-like dessication related protein
MRKIICLTLVLLAAASCIKLEEVYVKDAKIDNVTFNTMSSIGLDLVLTVENANKKNIIIDDVELDVWFGETYLGLIESTEKTTLQPQFNGTFAIPLRVSINNPVALTTIGTDFNSMLDKFEVTGFVKVKTGTFTKKHKVKKTSLKSLLKSL